MKTNNQNILVGLFRQIADLFKSAEEKERAVTIGSIWNEVNKRLDENPVYDSNGHRLWPYVVDIYLEATGPFAVVNREGKLYKIPVTVDENSQITLGEEQAVVMDFKPVTSRSLSIKRQADGSVRWFAMPACAAVLNRVGEIDSRELFDSFIQHIERDGGAYPTLDFFHLGEKMVLGHADWVARDGYLYLVSGVFEDTDIARTAIAAIEADPDFWGLSIAYLPTEEPEILRNSDQIEIPVFTKGINTYVSLLPESTAASLLTSISTQERGNDMEKALQDALKKLYGDDEQAYNDAVAKLDGTNRSATKMVNRAKPSAAKTPVNKPVAKSAPVAKPVAEKVERTETEGDEVEVTDEVIDAVMESPKFTERFNAMLEDALKARSADPGDEEDETTDNEDDSEDDSESEGEDVGELVLAELRTLNKNVGSLTKRVGELEKTRDASVQEVLNDLPSRVSRQQIIRPRSGATHLPSNVRTRAADSEDLDLSAIAESTLAEMGE